MYFLFLMIYSTRYWLTTFRAFLSSSANQSSEKDIFGQSGIRKRLLTSTYDELVTWFFIKEFVLWLPTGTSINLKPTGSKCYKSEFTPNIIDIRLICIFSISLAEKKSHSYHFRSQRIAKSCLLQKHSESILV